MEPEHRFQIISRRELASAIFSIEIEAPEIARHCHAGQFVVVRPTSQSERIPLTLVSSDASRAVVRLVFQVVGKTTQDLAALQPGESLADVRPSRKASMTVDPPRVTSPPANTAGRLVSPKSPIAIIPSLVARAGAARCTVGFGS